MDQELFNLLAEGLRRDGHTQIPFREIRHPAVQLHGTRPRHHRLERRVPHRPRLRTSAEAGTPAQCHAHRRRIRDAVPGRVQAGHRAQRMGAGTGVRALCRSYADELSPRSRTRASATTRRCCSRGSRRRALEDDIPKGSPFPFVEEGITPNDHHPHAFSYALVWIYHGHPHGHVYGHPWICPWTSTWRCPSNRR